MTENNPRRPISDDNIAWLRQQRAGKAPVPPADHVVTLVMVPMDALDIDGRYQRRISRGGLGKIRKIVADFSWSRFGAVIVARNGDRYSVIDGQHRAIAASALAVAEVPAILVSGDVAAQAQDFVGINTTRTSVASIDKFRARVTAGDDAAMTVATMLHNLEISTDVAVGVSLAPRQTRAVTVLEKLVKRIGEGTTFTALELMLDAQPAQRNLLTAFAIEVVAMTVARILDAESDLDRLEAVVADTDFESLKDEAGQMVKLTGGKTARRGHELLLRTYNKGLRAKVVA